MLTSCLKGEDSPARGGQPDVVSDSLLSLQESGFWIVAINLLVRISAESLKLESGARPPAARARLEGRRIWNQGSGVKEPEAGTRWVYRKPLLFKPSPCKQRHSAPSWVTLLNSLNFQRLGYISHYSSDFK